jgi:HEAT repeat protein
MKYVLKNIGMGLLASWVVVMPPHVAAQATSHDPSTPAVEVPEMLDEQTSAERQELLNDLNSDDSRKRIAALKALARLGPDAEFALPRLLEILTQPGSYERNLAIRCLARIGPAAAEAVPRLLEILKSKNILKCIPRRSGASTGSDGKCRRSCDSNTDCDPGRP